jgi:hypothetical protein
LIFINNPLLSIPIFFLPYNLATQKCLCAF